MCIASSGNGAGGSVTTQKLGSDGAELQPSVRIWFEDNGIGIPLPAQPRIFQMFQRASKGYEGTGVGLALVRKVVARMSGRVGFISEPGAGSKFWLDLRLAPCLTKSVRTGATPVNRHEVARDTADFR